MRSRNSQRVSVAGLPLRRTCKLKCKRARVVKPLPATEAYRLQDGQTVGNAYLTDGAESHRMSLSAPGDERPESPGSGDRVDWASYGEDFTARATQTTVLVVTLSGAADARKLESNARRFRFQAREIDTGFAAGRDTAGNIDPAPRMYSVWGLSAVAVSWLLRPRLGWHVAESQTPLPPSGTDQFCRAPRK